MALVVVTGTSRFVGAHVASRLASDSRVGRVVGVDTVPPPSSLAPLLAGVDLVRADLTAGTAEVADLIHDAWAVAHVGVTTVTSPGIGGRAGMKEQNVIGTMQLLAACQRAPGLRRLVVRSSTAAYGVSFRDPAVFTEDTEPGEVPRGGFARDILDLEGYVRGFQRRRPEVTVTVLRLVPLIGARADTTLTRYFSQPLVPTVLGRDPRLQFVHLDDALEVLHRSVVEDHPGTFNVAGGGVLTLSQAIRRAGRLPIPVVEPGLSAVAAFGKRLGQHGFGLDQVDLFTHGRVVDTTRLTKAYGVTPRPTAEAFADFLRGRGYRPAARPEWPANLRRRLAGEYEVDEFGFDPDLSTTVFHPLLRQLYHRWFRTELRGGAHLPEAGPALVVANHSGTVALDALMLAVGVREAAARQLRLLGADFLFRTPILSELARKAGGTLACAPDAERLLRAGELVGVFPEGVKGVGKPYRERYRLRRFGRGGFVSAALRTGVPIIPVSIVGAEETYPMIGDIKPLARLFGLPYFPVTPTFPWLGPLGLVPLPSRWRIEVAEPIDTTGWVGQDDDPLLVFNLADQVRETIQQTLHRLRAGR